MKRVEKVMEADLSKLNEAMVFIKEQTEPFTCQEKKKMDILIAAEEIFVNIASYAYGGKGGEVRIEMEISGEEEKEVTLRFIDSGTPFNPLEAEKPDLTGSVMERPIGGLGIYMAKKCMDGMAYEYEEGKNRLTMTKKLACPAKQADEDKGGVG